MAVNPTISNTAAIAACDAIVDLLDLGGAGTLQIYDGSQPTNPDVAISDQNLLAELSLTSPAFGDAVDDTPGGKATANAVTGDSDANATGTASWFRALNGGGTGVIDGSVGTSDADLILDSVSITSGQTVNVSSWTVTMPETS